MKNSLTLTPGVHVPAQSESIMALRHISMRVASQLIGAPLMLVLLASCGSVYDLYAPVGANINSPRTGNYENPDKYRVLESERKVYVATKTFSPPKPRNETLTLNIPMVDIEAGDVWVVTHRVQNRLVIFSAQYQARQERALSGRTNFLYSLFVDSDGRVNKGWLLLRDPSLVVLASERMKIMDPSVSATDGWPEEPVFAMK